MSWLHVLPLMMDAPAWAADLAVKRQEFVEIQRQLESKKHEIQDFRRQETGLRQDLSRLQNEASQSRQRLAKLEERIRESESKKASLRARLGALQLAEGRWRDVLAEELRGYQAQAANDSGHGGLQGLWEESFRRAAILEKLRYLRGVRGSRRTTEAAEAQVLAQAASLEARSQGVRAEHRSRETLVERTQAVFRETHGRVEQIQRAIRELQDSALSLSRLLRALERKSPYRIGGQMLPLAERSHSLPWPADGRLVSTFGRHHSQELGTVMIQQGVRFATATKAHVKPVKSGKVIFAGPFRSYGNVLIIDHGHAFYTIYGQLGELLRKKGDDVEAGAPMATAGDPGPTESGGVVYLEFRQGGEAVDPMLWLSNSPPRRGGE